MTMKEIERGDRQNNHIEPQSIAPNVFESNLPSENSLDSVKEQLELVRQYCSIDFQNDYLWNNYIPEFLKAFENWIKLNPESIDIENISKEFGFCIQEVFLKILSRKKNLPKLNKFVSESKKLIASFDGVNEIIDKKSREMFSEFTKLPVLKFNYLKNMDEIDEITIKFKKVLCEFIDIRNRCRSSDHLLGIIINYSSNNN